MAGGDAFGTFTHPGRASFDWAVLFSAVAILAPVSGLIGVFFSLRSRQKGYARWRSALAAALWCAFLGVVVRLFLHMAVFP
jgi:succinate dehydrogenase hydrophobic anchor subunit